MPDAAELDALMTRLADGDRAAFTPLYQRLWPLTLRLCMTMLGNEADAQDAAQDALHRVLSRTREYDRKRPALPWALGIASWSCRTQLKRQQRRKETGELPVTAADPGSPADVELERKQLADAAQAVLGTLSEVDRQTLLDSYQASSPTPRGATFRKRKERALARLRVALRSVYGLD